MEDIFFGNNGLNFEPQTEEVPYIKIIGVGGGGNNAANHMYRQGIKGVDFIVCNTDERALMQSPIPKKIKLGKSGLGAGSKPEVAENAAREKAEEIKNIISDNTKMLFITAGMGGGTGTGAAPVIAEIAKQVTIDDDVSKILVVAIVTMPFSFEGAHRKKQAEKGIAELKKHVDSILIINNDKLREFGNMGYRQALAFADDILLVAAKGIAEIITSDAYVRIDFRDVNTVVANSGTALMGIGVAEGEDRAKKAIEAATTSVLLNDNDISGAKNVLLYFSHSSQHELSMDEMGEITDYVKGLTNCNDEDSNVIWGIGCDDSLGEKLSITLIATGFEAKKIEPPVTTHTKLILDPPTPSAPAPVPTSEPLSEITIKPAEPKAVVEDVHTTPVTPEGTPFNPAGIYGGRQEDSIRTTETPTAKRIIHVLGEEDQPKKETTIQQGSNNAGNPIVQNIRIISNTPEVQTQTQVQQVEIKLESNNGGNKIPLNEMPTNNIPTNSIGYPNSASKPSSISNTGELRMQQPIERMSDRTVMSRADRIKEIHARLNDPNYLETIIQTPAYQTLNSDIHPTQSSAESDIKGSINTDGTITPANNYLYGLAD
ncbi:MAG: cell division protein FtsZ [Bacteroidales bacterium]|nr:cell division protein FtsZ [Bacteroidales bacterium]